MRKLTVGDLFSGIGGFSLGLERTGCFETRWFVELDPYCQRVLAKHWPDVRRYGDIREVHGILAHTEFKPRYVREDDECGEYGQRWDQPPCVDLASSCESQQQVGECPSCLEPVDLICGGFPCQPFSVAGKRGGKDDDRYLWPEMLRVISEVRPTWVLGENVAGIIHMELDTVLADLEAEGYQTQAFVIPACAVDAPHRRDRVWIVGYSQGGRERIGQRERMAGELLQEAGRKQSSDLSDPSGQDVADTGSRGGRRGKWIEPSAGGRIAAGECRQDVADTAGARLQKRGSPSLGRYEPEQKLERCRSSQSGAAYWLPEPDVGRVAHGVPCRVDRLRALGNAVVPQVVEVLGRYIIEAEASY